MVFKKRKMLCYQFSHGQNLVAQSFVHFENKKCDYKKKGGLMLFVELFTLHLVVYFVFLIKAIR